MCPSPARARPADDAPAEAWEAYEWFMFKLRITKRDKKHPGWRQTYIDCFGMCQFPDSEWGVCGDTELLELHDSFGEIQPVSMFERECKFQQRVFLCKRHHSLCHAGRFPIERASESMVHRDIDIEVLSAGSWQQWLDKFGLKEKVCA